MSHYSIAIDGPAASGKSTVAKAVAKKLNFLYIDTGAMYRAVTLFMLENNLDPKSADHAYIALKSIDIDESEDGKVFLNKKDVTQRVRLQDVTENVSYACAHGCVREKLVKLQREMANNHSVVMDGRDIGTVVLPDADLKIFQVASVESRAKRRYLENLQKGETLSLNETEVELKQRDYIDSHREISPLCQAADAILLDTSNLTIEQEIDAVLQLYEKRKNKLL